MTNHLRYRLRRFHHRLRARLLTIYSYVRFGRTGIPFASHLAHLSRFYHFLISELGVGRMQELATRYAAFVNDSTRPPNPPWTFDYDAITSIVCHPDRIAVRFPLPAHPGEVDYKLSEFAASLIFQQYASGTAPDGPARGVWDSPVNPPADPEAMFQAWRQMRANWKEEDRS